MRLPPTCRGARAALIGLVALAPACAEPPAPEDPPLHAAGPILWASDAARIIEGRGTPADEHLGHALDGGGRWLAREGAEPLLPDILVGGGSKYELDSTIHFGKRDTAAVFSGPDRERVQAVPVTRFTGGRGGVHFAHSVAWAGDLGGRGDGRSDVALGAPRAQPLPGEAGFSETGRLFVYFADMQPEASSPGVMYEADAGVIVEALEPGGRFGWSLAGPGDLDGDGVDDLVVGAPGSPATMDRPGRVYLISGAGLHSLRRTVGGPLTIPLDHPRLGARVIHGTTPGDRFGYAVAPAGDVDGDGLSDVIVGAPEFDDAGKAGGPGYVSVLFGTADRSDAVRSTRYAGEQFGSHFGCDVAGGVDLSGDGSPDLLVGASHYSKAGRPLLGRAYALDPSAPDGWLHVITGDEPNGLFGHAVEGLPSIDGDSLDEFAVGAPDASPDPAEIDDEASETDPTGGPLAGKAFVFKGGSGRPGGRPQLLYQVWGEQARDHCGWSLAAAGDLDGNGVDDLLVGALAHPLEPADERGRVYVLLNVSP